MRHVQGQGDDATVHSVVADRDGSIAVAILEDDAQSAAVGELDPLAQPALVAQAVQCARNRARVLPAFGGLPFESVHLLDDFDGNEDVVVLKIQNRVGIMEKNVGVENIIFHLERTHLILAMRRYQSWMRGCPAGRV